MLVAMRPFVANKVTLHYIRAYMDKVVHPKAILARFRFPTNQ